MIDRQWQDCEDIEAAVAEEHAQQKTLVEVALEKLQDPAFLAAGVALLTANPKVMGMLTELAKTLMPALQPPEQKAPTPQYTDEFGRNEDVEKKFAPRDDAARFDMWLIDINAPDKVNELCLATRMTRLVCSRFIRNRPCKVYSRLLQDQVDALKAKSTNIQWEVKPHTRRY